MITPTVIFTLASLILLTLIVLVAMFRYPPEHALKVWAIVGPMLGSTVGGGGAYFFASNSVEQVKNVANTQVAAVAQSLSSGYVILNQEKENLNKENKHLKDQVVMLATSNGNLYSLPNLHGLPNVPFRLDNGEKAISEKTYVE